MVRNIDDPLYYGPRGMRYNIAKPTFGSQPRPQAPSSNWHSVSAGVPSMNARHPHGWDQPHEEQFTRTNAFASSIKRDLKKQGMDMPTDLVQAGQFLLNKFKNRNAPAEDNTTEEPPDNTPQPVTPIKNTNVPVSGGLGPTSKVEDPYTRHKKYAKSHGITGDEFDRRWLEQIGQGKDPVQWATSTWPGMSTAPKTVKVTKPVKTTTASKPAAPATTPSPTKPAAPAKPVASTKTPPKVKKEDAEKAPSKKPPAAKKGTTAKPAAQKAAPKPKAKKD